MKLTVATIQKNTGFELRKDVSPTISKVGSITIAKHHEYRKSKFEDDDYNPIKLQEVEVSAAKGDAHYSSEEDDTIENDFIKQIDLVDKILKAKPNENPTTKMKIQQKASEVQDHHN
jgi:hypothetical protein